jgi:predicted DNA-binding protein
MLMTKQLHITMPDAAHTALKKLAADQRRPIADVAREAIENYLRAQGKPQDVTVTRGGKRGKED